MSTASQIREVYVRACPLEVALDWVRTQVSGLCVSSLPGSSALFCEGLRGKEAAKVIITPDMEDGFLSLCVDSPPFPWATHVDMARAVFADLHREVRCDPGDLGQAPLSASEWWSVGPDGEGLIVWPASHGAD